MPIFTNLAGTKMIKVPASKYKIAWDKAVASNFQFSVKQFLKQYWQYDIGVFEEFRIPGSKLRCDILNNQKKIAVEASGAQHFEYNKFFHGGSEMNFLGSIKRDDSKRLWLERNSFKMIELVESDVPKLSPEYILEKFGVDIT